MGRRGKFGQRGVLVLARAAVGAPAGTQLDLALVEMPLELLPFHLGRPAVLVVRAQLAAASQVQLVVPNHVLVEHGDVPPRRLEIGMAEERGTDVDRQPVVHQVGCEQTPEVVRRERQAVELRPTCGDLFACSPDQLGNQCRAHHAANLPGAVLEQER